ncbi:MAG: bifunctional UDP-3-O-[3-hydroxymyristoyl] N-acetylglucosamine deacetylase/3-hydroxyacyl-ACP dehydratase, partial [Candidatus Kapaibacterium sp.]
MRKRQRTIASPVSLSGVGLHTGAETTVTFYPAEEWAGIHFVRTDLEGNPVIPALLNNVVDTLRGTTIGNETGAVVRTVEHLLSALAGLEIDNCRIEIDGEEPMAGDGSSRPFTEVLKQAGFNDQAGMRTALHVEKPIHFVSEEHGAAYTLLPGSDSAASVIVDYSTFGFPVQTCAFSSVHATYDRDISSARTFCFLSEVGQLREQGLIKGGTVDNAVILLDRGPGVEELQSLVNVAGIDAAIAEPLPEVLGDDALRFSNEPARHKLLDLIGDLALLGMPIAGHIVASCPGHAANIAFAKHLATVAAEQNLAKRFEADLNDAPILDITGIMNILPHRYPFLLVDKIIDIDSERGKIVGVKNVTLNEPFFPGHFPEFPIMPGVLIIEAMAQTSGVLLAQIIGSEGNPTAVFMGIKEAKFRKPVLPGDTLRLEVTLTGKKFNTFALEGKAFVNGKVVT